MVVRELLLEDLDFLLEVRNDPTTRNFLGNNSTFTYQECFNWFETLKSPWFIIEVENKKVGYIRTSDNTVGIDIHMKERNKGYATQAYKLYLQTQEEVYLWVFDTNDIGKHIYEKLNFIYTGNTKVVRGQLYSEMVWKKS